MSGAAQSDERAPAIWAGSLAVWAALMVLFGLTLVLAYVPLSGWNAPVSYAIAGAKALLVLFFFMRLRKAPAILRLAAVAGLFWLVTLFALTLTDYPFRQAGEQMRTPIADRTPSAAVIFSGQEIP